MTLPLPTYLNPRAGAYRKGKLVAEHAIREFGRLGPVAIASTPDDIESFAERCHEDRVSMIGVSGGDGTLSLVLTALHALYGADLPTILLHPAGTTNGVARDLGLTSRAVPSHGLPDMPYQTANRWTVNAMGRLGFLVFAGSITKWMTNYAESARQDDLQAGYQLARSLANILLSGRLATGIGMEDAQVLCDGHNLGWPGLDTLMVGTVRGGALGSVPFFRVADGYEQMHAILFRTIRRSLLRHLPTIWSGRRAVKHPDIWEGLLSRLEIRGNLASQLNVDGETIALNHPLQLVLGPRVKFVLTPNR